jgi:ADP-ribose pyrophosphatase YjhB (NUDIX family)
MHHIQHYILSVLSVTKWARFSQMRPPKVDSNAYSYHLKLLVKQELIEKHPEKGYRLSPLGLSQVDRMSTSELHVRVQPKIITMALLYNENGEVLLLMKSKQPFIGAWTFASGKLHIEDRSIKAAVNRELIERVGLRANSTLKHAADVYIHAAIDGRLVSTVFSHVFTMDVQANQIARKDVKWSSAEDLRVAQLAPGVKEVYDLIPNADSGLLFAEFTIDW